MSYLKESIFKEGLIFGDQRQIQYLKEHNAIFAEGEEKRETGLRRWSVDVCEDRSYTIDVWAECEDDAIDKAYDIMEKGDSAFVEGMSFEVMNITEVLD